MGSANESDQVFGIDGSSFYAALDASLMLSGLPSRAFPMSTPEHFIPGKDASLEASIATLQSKLDALGFHIEKKRW